MENPAVESHGHSALRAKLTETEDAFVLKAELPGVKREDIEVNVLGDLLTIAGHFGSALENGAGDQPSTTNELRSGAFERRFQLNSPVDVSAVQASLVDGILSVQLPRAASAKPRRIEVKTEG